MKTFFKAFIVVSTIFFQACSKDAPSTAPNPVYPQGKWSATVDPHWIAYGDTLPGVNITVTSKDTTTIQTRLKLHVETDSHEQYCDVIDSLVVKENSTENKLLTFKAEPGFYNCTLTIDDSVVWNKTLGYEPTQIASTNNEESDFDDFWAKATNEANALNVNPQLTLIKKYSNSECNIWAFTIESVPDETSDGKPVQISGFYSELTAEGKHPIIVQCQALGSGGSDTITHHLPNAHLLTFWVRGENVNHPNPYGDWISYGLNSKDSYFYRGAFCDVLATLKFAKSRENVDTNQIFVFGGSQGGALTLIAAALDPTIKAISASIPFLGDFPSSAKITQWPTRDILDTGKRQGLTEEEVLKTLSYFDTKNFAKRIKCPVIMEMGLQDPYCPPRTTIAIYNNLTQSPMKSYQFNMDLQHQPSPGFYNRTIEFFNKFINEKQ